MKRRPCAYDANWPGNRYQALMMQLAIVREGNEQVVAELRAVRDGLRELKEMAVGMTEKLDGLDARPRPAHRGHPE
jgi:hypothetical protein